MKLQVNLAGSWRDVLHFAGADQGQVEYHAARLLPCAEGRVSMRIADEKNVAIAHLEGPKFEWQPTRRVRA